MQMEYVKVKNNTVAPSWGELWRVVWEGCEQKIRNEISKGWNWLKLKGTAMSLLYCDLSSETF